MSETRSALYVFNKMKIFIFLLLMFLIGISFAFFEENEDLIVEINDGKILGRHLYSQTGRSIRSFTGIPYAASPV